MTKDGSKVFFTTKDALTTATNQDTDSSADIYEAEVSVAGTPTLTRISTGEGGSAGNTDSCDPVGNSNGTHWNTVGPSANCGVVAVGGGGGVASGDGSIYFLSPELLNGPSNGTENQPNLYLARPGQAPNFVATLSPEDSVVLDSVKESETRRTADFQVTPSGEFSVFTSTLPLTPSVDNAGYTEIYRYDAATGQLSCVSCAPTNATATADASLASAGLNLTDDGRVFFNSNDALDPRDLDNKEDVYEWEPQGAVEAEGKYECQTADGCVALITTGISSFDSKLLSVSADGTDAFFFTHDALVPQDENGTLVRIYDARELGGFPYIPPPVPCKASDECHGPKIRVSARPGIRACRGKGNDRLSRMRGHRNDETDSEGKYKCDAY